MNNSDFSKDERCAKYQQELIEIFDKDQLSEIDQSTDQHLKSCPECQKFNENLINLKMRLSKSPDKKLQPDPRILKNILAFRSIKRGLSTNKPNPFWGTIRELFEYRIPVYQALGGIAVIFVLFLFISGNMVSSDQKAILIEYSGDYKELTSSELYLVDTLSLNNPERGQNAKEDSVLMSFLVPTM
jgi:hypothetical protein